MRSPRAVSFVVPFAAALFATEARADEAATTDAPAAPATPPPAPPTAPAAPATPPPSPAAPSPPANAATTSRLESRWYGWQTLLVDGAAIALAVASPNTPAAGYGAFGVYALGGPLVHVMHGRAGIGAADLGVRVGGPFVLGLAGMGLELATTDPSSCSGFCFRGLAGFAIGAFIGYVSAIVIDAAVFAREQVRADDVEASRARARHAVTLVPTLSLTPAGATAGFGGTM